MDQSSTKYDSEYSFLDNRRDCSKLLYVLAGYKPILWDIVFERIKQFSPSDLDICIISSGVYSKKIFEICEKNKWSYLSTTINKLTIAQNIALKLFDKAEMIFKMDEDVFVTEHFWDSMEKVYRENQRKYRIGFVGPLIPLHSYGFYRYIDIKNIKDRWSEFAPQFSNSVIGGHGRIENPALYSDEIADFLWDQCEQIDREARDISDMKLPIEFVNSRFPICAIMFERKMWEKMGGFEIGEGNGGGSDEVQIVNFCAENSYYIICAMNSICYHFGFAYQEHILYRKFNVFKSKFEIAK